LVNEGIFYEFVPVEEYGKPDARRLMIEAVELGKNYALIINSNAGLWGYSIGDNRQVCFKKSLSFAPLPVASNILFQHSAST